MDISCIISSGDLELYVLGMLSEEENLKVAQLAQMFPEIKAEIEAIENSLLAVSDETDAPAASVKDDLFAKLKNTPVSETLAESEIPKTVVESRQDGDVADKREATVLSMPQQPAKRSNGLLAASVIALVACAGIIAYLVGANNKYRDTTASLQQRVQRLEDNTNKQQQQLTQYQNSLALYQNPSYQKINLTNVPGKPEALVEIFWNKSTRDVYAANISLPAAPAGKQYQLWALIDGKPVSAGMITGKTLPQKMVDFAKADAFAITLENEGGSPTPHLDQLFVMGKTS